MVFELAQGTVRGSRHCGPWGGCESRRGAPGPGARSLSAASNRRFSFSYISAVTKSSLTYSRGAPLIAPRPMFYLSSLSRLPTTIRSYVTFRSPGFAEQAPSSAPRGRQRPSGAVGGRTGTVRPLHPGSSLFCSQCRSLFILRLHCSSLTSCPSATDEVCCLIASKQAECWSAAIIACGGNAGLLVSDIRLR